jgi:hypothetical protein
MCCAPSREASNSHAEPSSQYWVGVLAFSIPIKCANLSREIKFYGAVLQKYAAIILMRSQHNNEQDPAKQHKSF